MSRKYKFLNQEQAYFVSFAVVHWIDVFTRKIYCDKLVESLKYCQIEKGLILYGWCIMPSHVHLIMGTKKERMQNILRDLRASLLVLFGKKSKVIQSHPKESRKEWMMEMMIKTGLNNGTNRKRGKRI